MPAKKRLSGGTVLNLVARADEDGFIVGDQPLYRMYIGLQTVGANKIFFDLFNATGSGKKIKLLSLVPITSGAVAVTGALAVDLHLLRTSAVGTGGTAFTGDGVNGGSANTALGGFSIFRTRLTDAQLPVGITARAAPSGGATAGQIISWTSVFTEETNAGTYRADCDLVNRLRGQDYGSITIGENTGISVVQGAVASVGNIGFDVLMMVK